MPLKNQMGGPPPGISPQGLSSMIMPEDEAPMDGGDLSEPKPTSGAGGLKDVFDELQGTLDALASILPDYADELDDIKAQLSEVLAKAISGGASFKGRTGGGPISPASPSLPA